LQGARPVAIRKQEFYEGAALHLIARTGGVERIRYDAPFFVFNDRVSVLLKYSTRSRSPWGFTFTADEQVFLESRACEYKTAIALVCGSDGVAALNYEAYTVVAPRRNGAIHIACSRQHGRHYEVSGPNGLLNKKIAPSSWQKILEEQGAYT
jgi:hypothetical protein